MKEIHLINKYSPFSVHFSEDKPQYAEFTSEFYSSRRRYKTGIFPYLIHHLIINDIYIFQWRLLKQDMLNALAFCRTCPANFCTVCLSTQVCEVHVAIRNECYTE